MAMPEEFTVPQAAAYLNVSEETVRRNIRASSSSEKQGWPAVLGMM